VALSKNLRPYLRKSTWKIFTAVCTALVGAIGALLKIPDINRTLAVWLNAAIYTDPNSHQYALHPWFVPFEVLALAMAAGLLLLSISAIRQHFVSAGDAGLLEREELRKALNTEKNATESMMSAVKEIRNQAKKVNAPHALDSLTLRYFINKDLSGTHFRQVVIRGVNDPILFWESRIFASDEADSVDSLSAIHFSVRDLSVPPHKIVYLPTENQARIKRACLFFLPLIQPGESRTFEVSYQWPGLFNRLNSTPEDFEYEELTSEPIPFFRLEFYLQEGQGRRLHCEVNGPPHDNMVFGANEYQDPSGWKGFGYVYEIRNVPAGQGKFGLRIELKD